MQQLVAQGDWADTTLQFHHYRDRDKVEVDCVISYGNKVWGVEVKTAHSVKPADYVGLARLAEQTGKDSQSGIVMYAGDSVLPGIDERFLAVPVSKLWEM